ncbi:MAG: oligosaccharide flippase family protein [Anaerolineae bacterium]|nr:oligosaccharide flippase family protein [Anaerolineae bacterium]
MNVGRRAVHGTVYLAVTRQFTQVYYFATSIILARLLDPAQFGTIGLAIIIFSFISRARLFGFNYVLISKSEAEPRVISTHFLLQAGLTAIVVGATFLLRPVLLIYYEPQVINVLVVVAVLSLFDAEGLAATAYALITKELRFKELSLFDVLVQVSAPLVAIGLAYYGFGVWALVARQAWETLINFILYWYASPWKPWHGLDFDWDAGREYWAQGKHLWVSGFSTFIVFGYDDLLVGSWSGAAALGYYNRAYNFSKLPMSFLGSIMQVAYPTYTKAKSDPAKLSLAFNIVLSAITLISMPASVFLAVAAPELVVLLIGEKWLPSVPLLQLLVVYSILRPISDVSLSLPMAMEMPAILSKIAVIQTVSMLILCTVLTYFFEAAGAALSADVVVLMGVIIIFRAFVTRHVTVDYWELFGSPILATVAATMGVFVALSLVSVDLLILRLALKTVIFGLIYLSLLILIQRENLVHKFQYIYGFLRKKNERS